MLRPPWLSASAVQTLIDRLNAWLRYLTETPEFKAIRTADATITGELKGARSMLVAGKALGFSGSAYLEGPSGTGMSVNHGYVMPRAGSIVSCSVQLLVDAGEGAWLTLEVRVNGTATLTAKKATPTADYYSWYATAPRGTHKFAAGDLIQFYITDGGTTSKEGVLAIAEVQFDT